MSYSSISTAATSPTNDESPKHRLYRTKQCKHYLKGFCLYGDECGFAHGDTDKLPYPTQSEVVHAELNRKVSRPGEVQRSGSIQDELDCYKGDSSQAEEVRKSLVDELLCNHTERPRSLSLDEISTLFKGW